MAAVRSPDDYRRMAGYRRSEAPLVQRIGGSGPVHAYTTMDIDDPLLRKFMAGGRASASGITVTEKLALRDSGFFRACNLISSSVGMLPTFLYRRLANGETEKAKDHPLFAVLHKRPNSYQTAFEFKSYMQLVALLDGNAYARIIWGVKKGKRAVLQLVPMPRGSVDPVLGEDMRLRFRYSPPTGGQMMLEPRDVFHFRHPLTLDGINGISLLDVAVETLGLAAAAARALAKMLAKGIMAGGSIELPAGQTLDDDAYERLKKSLSEDYGGAENAGDWFLLEDGASAKPFVNAKDSQTDEMRKRQVEDIARFTDIPRPLLMLDETSWGSGIRELGLFLVTYCLSKWFVAWEQAIERSCLTEDEQDADELYVKFNEGALLRGSLKEQAEFFAKALGNNAAWMVPNEVRVAFELNPRDDGNDLPKGVKPSPTPKEDDDG